MNMPHLPDCTRIFKNYDINCPRCNELKNGAVARKPWWVPSKFKTVDGKHDCKASGCQIVCTYGDW
jgi:hypothetical protein